MVVTNVVARPLSAPLARRHRLPDRAAGAPPRVLIRSPSVPPRAVPRREGHDSIDLALAPARGIARPSL